MFAWYYENMGEKRESAARVAVGVASTICGFATAEKGALIALEQIHLVTDENLQSHWYGLPVAAAGIAAMIYGINLIRGR